MSEKLNWWRRDRYGYPIEFTSGRPVRNFFRTICLNLKKFFNPYYPSRQKPERKWPEPPKQSPTNSTK